MGEGVGEFECLFPKRLACQSIRDCEERHGNQYVIMFE
jgi:hypothetical protein